MATTSTTTSTAGATTSSTAAIVKTLGSGSGLDVENIVSTLVTAQYAAKNSALTKRADALTTQISGLAKLKSGITGFDSALKTLVKGGTLTTQPTSSTAAVGVSSIAGSSAAGLSARVSVTQLAAAQAATTNAPVARTDAFRAGKLTVTIGGTMTDITIGSADATIEGVAKTINAAGLGRTATVVTDGGGARLTIKGQSGAAKAFTIAATDDDPNAAGNSLAMFAVGANATGTTIGTQALDARLTVDGAGFTRASNTIADLLPGVKLELKELGTTTLGSSAPGAALAQAVNDFVATFNELSAVLKEQLDPVSGALRNDPAAASLQRSLGQLTTVSLAANAAGQPRTLADLGVGTNRDGTLAVDSARLVGVLASAPAAVEAMFADGGGAGGGGIGGGLSAALSAIATRATDRTAGFDAETTRYTAQQSTVADAQSKATDAAAAMKERLTKQFASMDSKVAAYKSTGAFLTQQVDAWYAKS